MKLATIQPIMGNATIGMSSVLDARHALLAQRRSYTGALADEYTSSVRTFTPFGKVLMTRRIVDECFCEILTEFGGGLVAFTHYTSHGHVMLVVTAPTPDACERILRDIRNLKYAIGLSCAIPEYIRPRNSPALVRV